MRVAQFNLFSLLFASNAAQASLQFNLTSGITPISHDIYDLHMTVFWVCVGIGSIVFSTMFYSIINHRKSKGAKPAQFHENLLLEITWTIIPFLILVSIAIPGTRVLMHMNDTAQPDLTIKITGYQWKWRYEYVDQGISFFSNLSTPPAQISGQEPKNPNYLREVDHPLVVPIHKKVRFLVTSNDVIHSWWVPDLGVKKDAVPGFINEAWARINRPGTYRGQCVELCGVHHGFMPIVVTALSEAEFDKWINEQKGQGAQAAAENNKQLSLDELIQKGKTTYQSICAACHKPDGAGMPPTFPNLKISPVVNGVVDKHIHTVVFGVTGTAMQAFGKQLSPAEIAGVITYERNEIGSKKGDIVQPADIVAAEGGTPASNAGAGSTGSSVTNASAASTSTPASATKSPAASATSSPAAATSTPTSTTNSSAAPSTPASTSNSSPAAPSAPASNISSPATPSNTSSPATPSNTSSPAAPSNTSSPATPSNTSSPATPSNTSSPSTPSNTISPATPSNTSSPATPSNTSSPAAPSSPSADLKKSTEESQSLSAALETKLQSYLKTQTIMAKHNSSAALRYERNLWTMNANVTMDQTKNTQQQEPGNI